MTCKDTLAILHVSHDEPSASKFLYSYNQYNRLVSQLEHFTKLEQLQFPVKVSKSLQDLDSVVDKCTKSTTMALMHNDRIPASNSFLSPKVDVTKVKKYPNMTMIYGEGCIENDHAMKYIMQKFENFELSELSLPACLSGTIVRYYDITLETAMEFMNFLGKMGSFQVEFLVSNSLVFQMLDFYHNHSVFNIEYCDASIQNHASLKDNDNNGAVLLNLNKYFEDISDDDISNDDISNNGTSKNNISDDVYAVEIGLRHNYTGQEMPHLELLERYGHRFKHLNLDLSSRTTGGSKHVQDLVREYFLDHIFKHCPNLKILCLTGCPFQRCNPSMSKNHSITF